MQKYAHVKKNKKTPGNQCFQVPLKAFIAKLFLAIRN